MDFTRFDTMSINTIALKSLPDVDLDTANVYRFSPGCIYYLLCMVRFLRLFFILSAYLLYLALPECSVSLIRPQGMLM